ncbi:hypothetical protein GGR56DRAFT_80683 [Xylariaceae sp. FL0804]|nr:hypothetical protein GGR56DRAFT_80683 [Xylariaceae sp. FL0804]
MHRQAQCRLPSTGVQAFCRLQKARPGFAKLLQALPVHARLFTPDCSSTRSILACLSARLYNRCRSSQVSACLFAPVSLSLSLPSRLPLFCPVCPSISGNPLAVMRATSFVTALVTAAAAAPGLASASIFLRRQAGAPDTPGLYLCSNPDFNSNCDACACDNLTNIDTTGDYGVPPCYQLPPELHVGPPQGVSSARSYSKWNCTLYDNPTCSATAPNSSLVIPPGPPGLSTMGSFDDRAVSYQCYVIGM